MKTLKQFIAILIFCLCIGATSATAQTNEFTYQGKLTDMGTPSPTYDFEFRLCTAESTGDCSILQLMGGVLLETKQRLLVSVSNGIFTVKLDFLATHFTGADRFLEIRVRRTSGDPWTQLNPRQKITSSPYAIKSLSANGAAVADSLSPVCSSCVMDGQINSISGSKVTGQVFSALSADFATFAQNVSGVVSIANGGTGSSTQNFIDLSMNQSNIGGNKTFTGNLTVNSAINAPVVNVSSEYRINDFAALRMSGRNTFVGNTGQGGTRNSFLGDLAGAVTVGADNAFFGTGAGNFNSAGGVNSFFGSGAGGENISGSENAFFGFQAGFRNKVCCNSFFGRSTGALNVNGQFNSFFGTVAGFGNTDGSNNTFVGISAGSSNTLGSNNTILGAGANVLSPDLTFATAIGANATVAQSNSLVLGNSAIRVGIGTSAPLAKLHIGDNNGQIIFGGGGCSSGHNGIGFGATLTCNNYSLLGNGTDTLINRPTGGAIFFRENNVDQMIISVGGAVTINTLGMAGGTQLCRNASNQISNCSSSLRYKTNIAPFSYGLSFIKQLRPITFDWKEGGSQDVGFGAEDVAKINPLFVTYNQKGEVEGVKYDRLGVITVNAIREQQEQIERQQKQIESQQQQIDALKRLVCATNPSAEICKEEQK